MAVVIGHPLAFSVAVKRKAPVVNAHLLLGCAWQTGQSKFRDKSGIQNFYH
jgi:hypothetical protein